MGNQCSSNVLRQTISADERARSIASSAPSSISSFSLYRYVDSRDETGATFGQLDAADNLDQSLESRALSRLMDLCQQQSPPLESVEACVDVIPKCLQRGVYLTTAIQNWTNSDALDLLLPNDIENRQQVLLSPYAENGWLPLHLACHAGNESAALHLLNLQPLAARCMTNIEKQTALTMVCMRNGSEKLIHKLLSVFPEASSLFDNEGMFPMEFYARLPHANIETLCLLVPKSVFGHCTLDCVDPTLLPSVRWIEDLSALLISAIRKETPLAQILKVDIFRERRMKPFAMRIFSTLDDSGHSPLHAAIQMGGRLEVAEYILQAHPKGAEQLTSVSGRSALSLACEHDGVRRNSFSRFISLLVALYPEAIATPCANGRYPLQYACDCGATSTIISVLARDDVCSTIVKSGQADQLVQCAIDSGCNDAAVAFLAEKFLRLQPAELSIRECCICLEPLETGVSRTHCGHEFHTACIAQLTGKSGCPLCRSPLIRADFCRAPGH